jgi:hypothetical protein
MSENPISRRLDSLSQSWDNDIPAKFLWTVNFTGRTGLLMEDVGISVSQVLRDYDDRRFSVVPNLFDKRSDDNVGFLFAQSVALPSEQVTIGTLPVKGSGGFVAGYYGDRRVDYGSGNKLDITFLEQNKDIVDMFIRPWLVATSYYGLIEDDYSPYDLKCNIQINLHTRNPSGYQGQSQFIKFGSHYNKRKSYIFEDCAPINIEGDQISYNEITQNDLERTTSFTFSKYKLLH